MKKLDLQTKIIIGLASGIAAGFAFNFAGGANNEILSAWVFPLLTFVGDLFIRLIRMCVVPLVFFSIAEGVANLGDVGKLRSIGVKTFAYIIVTGIISAGLGVFLGSIFKPGVGAVLDLGNSVTSITVETPNLYGVLLGFFAINPFEALANANMMPIITFSVFCGCAMLLAGERGNAVKEAFGNFTAVVGRIVDIVLKITPYGAFALIAGTIGKFGAALLGPMLKFFVLDWVGLIFIQAILFNLILLVLAKANPLKFWKRAVEPWIIAFTTGSSNSALPVNMRLADEMGIPNEISAFVLPIGATANMNGICCYLGLLAVFAAQIYNIPLSFSMLAYIAFECVVLAIGTAAVPSGGVIMATTLFTVLGFPLEIVDIVAGAYKIIDGIHTATNSIGDLVVSTAVAAREGVLDMEKYNDLTQSQLCGAEDPEAVLNG